MGDEKYTNRISIPYIKPTGVVDIRYRATLDSPAKYLSRPGSEPHIYNTPALLRATDVMCVTEGEMDTITLHQMGIDAVGIPGVNNWQDHWAALLEGFRRLVIFGDGDAPGIKFATTLAKKLKGISIEMPEGYDVNNCYNDPDYGPDWIKERVYG